MILTTDLAVYKAAMLNVYKSYTTNSDQMAMSCDEELQQVLNACVGFQTSPVDVIGNRTLVAKTRSTKMEDFLEYAKTRNVVLYTMFRRFNPTQKIDPVTFEISPIDPKDTAYHVEPFMIRFSDLETVDMSESAIIRYMEPFSFKHEQS